MSATKGFTLIEMLICLMIVSVLSLLSIHYQHDLNFDHLDFINAYLDCQVDALSEKRNIYFENNISFNSSGNVNQAKSVFFNKHKVIVHLGNGYISYE